MEPKTLSESVLKGFVYLINQQHANGGWSQGGGWRSRSDGGRMEGPDIADPPDVANTCVATLALLRGGHLPCTGEFSANIVRALEFIMTSVEASDGESPYVTELRGTQVQTKIGPLVDTFMATQVLAEARGHMPNEAGQLRLEAALAKAIAKLERHQGEDGSWAMHGWAPVVGQGLASAALGRARQRGAKVSEESLDRAGKFARGHYDIKSKSFGLRGSPGVPLYSVASHLSSSQHSVNSYQALKAKLRKTATDTSAPMEERNRATIRLKEIEQAEEMHAASLRDTAGSFKDARFMSGFGSNGGEEFLSYLQISETLHAQGGTEWQEWDRNVTEALERIQNQDGSWSGHHCITGRTFCTAAALLVLLADRAPQEEPVVHA